MAHHVVAFPCVVPRRVRAASAIRLNRQDGQDVYIELVVEATGAVEEVLANTAITGATYDIDGRQQFVA